MKYVMFVVGPAGSGKSTFCDYMQKHFAMLKRSAWVMNFDPACDDFLYEALVDIRDLISLDDVTDPSEDLRLGPNGGLVYCMEYLQQNLDWLDEVLSASTAEDDCIFIDCPGQIELYTHMDVFTTIMRKFESHNFRMCSVFLLDAQFLTEKGKFMGGVLAALSAMVKLEIAHVNIMTKMDLLSVQAKEKLEQFMDPGQYHMMEHRNKSKTDKMADMLYRVIEDYSMVQFFPLDRSDDNSLQDIVHQLDCALQYGDDIEVKTKDFEDYDDE